MATMEDMEWVGLAQLQGEQPDTFPRFARGRVNSTRVDLFVDSGNTLGSAISPELFHRLGFTEGADLTPSKVKAVRTADKKHRMAVLGRAPRITIRLDGCRKKMSFTPLVLPGLAHDVNLSGPFLRSQGVKYDFGTGRMQMHGQTVQLHVQPEQGRHPDWHPIQVGVQMPAAEDLPILAGRPCSKLHGQGRLPRDIVLQAGHRTRVPVHCPELQWLPQKTICHLAEDEGFRKQTSLVGARDAIVRLDNGTYQVVLDNLSDKDVRLPKDTVIHSINPIHRGKKVQEGHEQCHRLEDPQPEPEAQQESDPDLREKYRRMNDSQRAKFLTQVFNFSESEALSANSRLRKRTLDILLAYPDV